MPSKAKKKATETVDVPPAVVAMLSPDQLDLAPFNPRRTFREETIAELAGSILQHGVLQPIVVRELDGRFQVVCGARRTLAAIKAALTAIPAVIRDLTDQQAIEASLTENMVREDVEPMEEAHVIDGLAAFYDTDQALADRLGRSAAWVSRRRRLLGLIPALQESIEQHEFPLGWYEIACRLTEEDQAAVLGYVRVWPGGATPKRLRDYLTRTGVRLESAPFELDQPIGGRPACEGCPHNTASQADLFDADEPAMCRNRTCFDEKAAMFAERFAQENQLPLMQVNWSQRAYPEEHFDETIHKGLTRVVVGPGSQRGPVGQVLYVEVPEPRPEGEIDPEKLKRRAYLATCKRENWIRWQLLESLGRQVAVLGELDVTNALANLHYILWRVMRGGNISIQDKHRISRPEFLGLAQINGYDEKTPDPDSRKALLASLIWEACHEELACKDWAGQNREHQPDTAIQEAYTALGADYLHYRQLFEGQWAEKSEGKKAKEGEVDA